MYCTHMYTSSFVSGVTTVTLLALCLPPTSSNPSSLEAQSLYIHIHICLFISVLEHICMPLLSYLETPQWLYSPSVHLQPPTWPSVSCIQAPLLPIHNLNSSYMITIQHLGLRKLKHILREGSHIFSLDHTTYNFFCKWSTKLLQTIQHLLIPHSAHLCPCISPPLSVFFSLTELIQNISIHNPTHAFTNPITSLINQSTLAYQL